MGRNYALNTAQIKRAAELYEVGYSRRDIGGYFGCSDGAAGHALVLAGVKLRDNKEAVATANRRRPTQRRRVRSVFDLAAQAA